MKHGLVIFLAVGAQCAAGVICLERTVCFGACPAYSLKIDSSGTVSYEGKENVAVLGKQTARITPKQFRTLLQAFDNIDFYSLQNKYIGGDPSDLPTTYVGVTVNGQTKTVTDYAQPPAGLRDLERQIDRMVNVHQWLHDKTTRLTLYSSPVKKYPTNIEDLKDSWTVDADSLMLIKPGMTPLMHAVFLQERTIISQAIRSAQNINAADETGWSPLMFAAVYDHADAVSMVLNAGAAPNQKDIHGDTALIGLAALAYHPNQDAAVLRLLLSKGAVVDATNQMGETALMWAAKAGYSEGLKALLKAGANPKRKDLAGHDALFYLENARTERLFAKDRVSVYNEAGTVLKQALALAHPTHQLP